MFRSRYLFGMLLIALGVIFLLHNLGLAEVDIGYIFRTYWPVFLLFWGFNLLPRPSAKGFSLGEFLPAAVLLFLGAAFLLRNLGLIDLNLRIFMKFFWPVVLILAGLSLLRGKTANISGERVAFMSGLELKKMPWSLKENDSFFAVMGGMELDLRQAKLPPGEAVLDLAAVMGGIEVTIPEGLPVTCEATAVLGGIDFLNEEIGGLIAARKFEANAPGDPNAVYPHSLYIQSRAILGGITIRQ
ncbi:MAG: cell wall-active antibiotics response protein [Firmicutes bacterium]|nr:cell wall-active antibiotics response protein [Bacillota bacterium]